MLKYVPILLLLFACTSNAQNGNSLATEAAKPESLAPSAKKITAAKAFCKQKGLSTNIALLFNGSTHSGLKRLFVYDLKKNIILHSLMVSHGCCKKAWRQDNSAENPVYNNIPNSHCSSLGKYRIGERGHSQWGIGVKYLLHGYESSNNKALERYIVLHSWDAITENETYPKGSAESWGCPAVSNNAMRTLDALLKKESKDVLLWIYIE